jgi:hypothetical protein
MHPQTCGKNERFNQTLKRDVLNYTTFTDLSHCQQAFDRFREIYNQQRPHESLDDNIPASRYRLSPRAYPENLKNVEYAPGIAVRKVTKGWISFKGRRLQVGEALRGYAVGVRPGDRDGLWDVYFCNQKIRSFDLVKTNL